MSIPRHVNEANVPWIGSIIWPGHAEKENNYICLKTNITEIIMLNEINHVLKDNITHFIAYANIGLKMCMYFVYVSKLWN